jgi:CheY-like chemotaxis protein
VSETPKPDPRRVVLVDDSQEIRQVLRVLFENNGFEVVGEAESGVGVLDIVLQKKPAFVILDMRMPNIAGEETARAIRKAAPDTHIVAFSAFLEEQPEWADAFLNKDRINQIPSLLKGLVDGDATA